MGIQGLGGYLDNNDLTVYYDKALHGGKNFKYLYLDFQSIIYTVFNYQENIINLMLSNIHAYDRTHSNKDNNMQIFAILNKMRLLIKDTEFGKKLFKFKGIKATMSGLKDIDIDYTEKDIIYNKTLHMWENFENDEIIDFIKQGIENYILNKMEFVTSCILELITNLIDNFDNLEECHIVFDGKPFVAKMIEQVKRRTPDIILNDMIVDVEASLTKNSHINLPKSIQFNRGLISRDSDFVKGLIKSFQALNLKVKGKAKNILIEVISTEDGEGEHIINKRILQKAMSDEEGNFLYYSPDGDVVFLIMILNIILRMKGKRNFVNLIKFELIDYTYYKFDTKKININHSIVSFNDIFYSDTYTMENRINVLNQVLEQTKIKLQYNDITKFENKLVEDINSKIGKLTNKSKDIMLVQYIILFSIFGNDFIPKLLSQTIGKMEEIAKIFNDYLIKMSDLSKLTDLLTKDTGDIKTFNFLANFDGENIILNQTVLTDFFKELQPTENVNISKILRNEARKGSKDISEYMESFLTKFVLFNYTNENLSFEFLKYLLFGNYFISLDNTKMTQAAKNSYKLDRINLLVNKNDKTEPEKLELNTLQDKYYKEVLYDNALKYLNYYISKGQNPLIINWDKRKPVSPFTEIIFYNNEKQPDISAIPQYIQGFQYISDLYFTCDIKNKCWHYQHEYPPKISEIVKYMEANKAKNLFDYSGFYGAEHEKLYNQISHSLTRKVNTKYIKEIKPEKYYLIPTIFDCFNVRYLNKCQLHGDTNIVFIDEEGNIVNIMDAAYDISQAKPQQIIKLAKEFVGGSRINYYEKYLKYKVKYLKLKI
jgi:hypothetical protein